MALLSDVTDATLVCIQSDYIIVEEIEYNFHLVIECSWYFIIEGENLHMKHVQKHVPVVDKEGNPLMPTTPTRAAMMVKCKDATPFWNHGIWCIRLNREPSGRYKQDIAVGIDPGSKKEGYTVKSEKYTYLNVQADAHTTTKGKIKRRREARRSRRGKNCRGRKWRGNRSRKKGWLPPSTRDRWFWKIRVVDWLRRMFPINYCVVEDIVGSKKLKIKGNLFSALEVGKKWFYKHIEKRFKSFYTLKGYETKKLRDLFNLKKIDNKLSSDFHAHCVDSWILATHAVKGDYPRNKEVYCIKPLSLERRSLHDQLPKKGGIRPRSGGGTNCAGITKGTLVKHIKHGLAVIYGYRFQPTKKEPDRMVYSIQKLPSLKRYLGIRKEDFKILKRLNFLFI